MGFIKKPEKAIQCFNFSITSYHLISLFFSYSPSLISLDFLMSLHEGKSKILFENAPN